MKTTLLPRFLVVLLILSAPSLFAQKDRFAYAVTDVTKDGSNWTVLRKLDLNTGEYSSVLIDETRTKSFRFDLHINKASISNAEKVSEQPGLTSSVAALALDKKQNRLYFTPMNANEIGYINLSSMKVVSIPNALPSKGLTKNDAGKIISRMAIAPDGTGYAISNDGSIFIEFSTGKKPSIKPLGALVDDPRNKSISIHNSCTSFGGDIVTDEKGMIYLFTGVNNIFKINPQTKVATYLGSIKGLPPGYTTSACAVMEDGKLLIGSTGANTSNYIVDSRTWQASPFKSENVNAYHTADFANSNYLSSTGKKSVTQIETVSMPKLPYSNNIQVYPNPIADNAPFNIQFDNVAIGNYLVQLVDLTGRVTMVKKVAIGPGKSTQVLPVSYLLTKGLYMVRVVNESKNIVFEQKLVIQ